MRRRLLLVALLVLVSSCMSWKPGWQEVPDLPGQGELGDLVEEAVELTNRANTRDELRRLVRLYDAMLRLEPGHPEALRWAANYRILLGAGYARTRSEKREQYRQALTLCERAMARNPEFRSLVEGGEEVWEACRVLTREEAAAMGDWCTAVFYHFREGLGISRILQLKWIQRAMTVLDRLDEVAPGWSGGGSDFSRGIVLMALPEGRGGDLAEARRAMDRAEQAGPRWLLAPWGRAKYIHVRTGDREGFVRDLEWVLAQDPKAADSPYPWNVFFQKDARKLLAQVDQLF